MKNNAIVFKLLSPVSTHLGNLLNRCLSLIYNDVRMQVCNSMPLRCGLGLLY